MIISSEISHIAVEYTVDPELACGGVWNNAAGKIEPVSLRDPAGVPTAGGILHEYQTPTGDIRACLLQVEPGKRSETWEILDSAHPGYYEESRTVAGRGLFLYAIAADFDRSYTERMYLLPEPPIESISILPWGDRLQVRAAEDVPVAVLTTFSGAPLQPEYEKTVHHEWAIDQARNNASAA